MDQVVESDENAHVRVIQRYFRHLIMWLAQETTNDEIPLVTQDALLRLVLVMLRRGRLLADAIRIEVLLDPTLPIAGSPQNLQSSVS